MIEDEIMINIQNFVNDWFTKALNDKRHESFRILKQFHFFYKFDISSEWYTTDIFYANNLIKVADSKQSSFTR